MAITLLCTICGNAPCLRQVGTKGFCITHVPEAFEAAEKSSKGHSTWQHMDELDLPVSPVSVA